MVSTPFHLEVPNFLIGALYKGLILTVIVQKADIGVLGYGHILDDVKAVPR